MINSFKNTNLNWCIQHNQKRNKNVSKMKMFFFLTYIRLIKSKLNWNCISQITYKFKSADIEISILYNNMCNLYFYRDLFTVWFFYILYVNVYTIVTGNYLKPLKNLKYR